MSDEQQALEPLTEQEIRFADEYIISLNKTKAARKAHPNQTYNSLRTTGVRMYAKANIRAYIDERLEQLGMSRHEIIARLADQARGDVGDFIDPDTLTINMKTAKELGITRLIKKYKVTTITGDDKDTHIFEFELHDPQAALVHLGRAQALFTDKQDVTTDGKPLPAPLVYLPQVNNDSE